LFCEDINQIANFFLALESSEEKYCNIKLMSDGSLLYFLNIDVGELDGIAVVLQGEGAAGG
jgi:hypothetical protein